MEQTSYQYSELSIFNASEFFIPTPMIEELEHKLQSWLWNGITGGVILGRYRTGKTRAIRYLSERLHNRLMQPVPVRCLTIKQRDVGTVASIFKNLCFALDMTLKTQATSDEMANLLVHYFGELALLNDTKQAVLIVDEMQRLQMKQLEAFAELYDSLSELKINLVVVFVGNFEASKSLINEVIRSENELVRGRFFTQSYSYFGIRSQEEVKDCLQAYDAPVQSGLSITETFLSEQYQAGFRLVELSGLIWEVFDQDYRRPLQLDSWGMQYFTSMVKILLVDYMPSFGVDNDDVIRQMIYRSIEASGLVPSLVELK